MQTTEAIITRTLITQLHPSLLQYARRFVSAADAEDVVQATWIGALRGADTFSGRSSMLTWLRAILRRRIFDLARSRRRFEPLLDDDLPAPWRLDEAEHSDMVTAAGRATAALANLSEAERRALVLVDLDGMERDAVSERLQVSRGHLRVILFRARQKVSQSLQREGFDAELFG
jgi:RNA polymerase sigma-70 factor, ECF subfamily